MRCTRLPLIAALAVLPFTASCEEEVRTPDSPPSAELGPGGDDLPPRREPTGPKPERTHTGGLLPEPPTIQPEPEPEPLPEPEPDPEFTPQPDDQPSS